MSEASGVSVEVPTPALTDGGFECTVTPA